MTIAERVRGVVEAHRGERGALLPILHHLQREFGWIDPQVVPVLADELNLSRADVHGVISFYTDFRSEPAGTTTVKICRAEACQSVGAERLVADAEQVFGVKVGQTTPDRSAKHPGFHATDTVDYAICLEGEVWAVLDDDETLMRPGDVLIQRGTHHAWSNRSDRICRMAFILIDADPLDE